MWTICLLLSVAAVLVTAVLIVRNAVLAGRHAQHKTTNWLYILFAGTAVAIMLMFLPIHAVQTGLSMRVFSKLGFMDFVIGGVHTLALSLFNTVQVFTAGAEFSLINEGVLGLGHSLRVFHSVWAAILFALAPCFTFGAVLSLFKNAIAHWRYRLFGCRRDVYVFTELNEYSVTLAEDIRRNEKHCTLVFTDVFEENAEVNYELLDRAKAVRAICFKKDVLAVRFRSHASSKAIYFFAIGTNEAENLSQSVKLIEQYRDRDNTHLFAFSTGIEGELMLTAVDKGKMHVRRVNQVRSTINRLLYNEGHELFETALEESDGTKRVSAMIVGMGGHGTEMVKALAWFGQMDGYTIDIHAFDVDPLAKDRFTVAAPELMAKAYNGVKIDGEAQYTIEIHAGVDVESVDFVREVAKLTHTTYVLVSLGNDERNIRTAIYLRMLFERMHIHPQIRAIVHNTAQKEALTDIRNYRDQAYDIRFIGDIRSSFSQDVIMHSKLEEDALSRHLKWGKEEEFWAYEYNYRSSTASAIHMKARIACGIVGADKEESELTDEERYAIEVLEHRRWNAYMRAEGYVFSGSKDKASRNDLGKMHHDLVDFESLTDEDKRKDSAVGLK